VGRRRPSESPVPHLHPWQHREVYPNVITPLCGSIVKGPIARGQEQVLLELGAVVPHDLVETDRAVLTGCFGGYLYANLSVGLHIPGQSCQPAGARGSGA
jgi:hypothetical protein